MSKFSVYVPDDDDKRELVERFGVMFLKNADGVDWYDCRQGFSSDTLKIGYDDSGRVATFSKDVYALMPVDLAVAELPATDENMRVTLGADWFYSDGRLTQKIDFVAQAESERNRRMNAVSERITWLTAAAEDEDITDDEVAELKRLKEYRTELRRLDVSAAPDITWPELQ